MGQERTDEELLAEYQQGDPGAFEALLRRYRAPLFTFLLRMLGDREKAADLAQETFLRIVKGAQAWEHRARFQTWLFTIARNLCADGALREQAGLPFREIAELVGVNENTVKSRMRYALLALRKSLLAAGVSGEQAAD